MFQSKTSTAWQPHPALAAIRDDDPELQGILAGIRSPVSSMNQIIDAGPHKKTVIYDHLRSYDENQDRETGLLKTWTSMGRRHAFALDHAKYLLVLKIIGEKKNQRRQTRHVRLDHAATKPSALSAAASATASDAEGLSPTS